MKRKDKGIRGMNKEEIEDILEELHLVRPEILKPKAKKLFEAIMSIADERDELQQENQELKDKIKELIKYGYGTDMSLGEFKEFYKLGTGKDYNPNKCPEVE